MPPTPTFRQRRHYLFGSSVRPLAPISHGAIYLYCDETCHKYSSCQAALLKRFSRLEFKGQGHSKSKCTFSEEAYGSTVRRQRPSCLFWFVYFNHSFNFLLVCFDVVCWLFGNFSSHGVDCT